MKEFDEDNPPETFEEFTEGIKKLVQDTVVTEDEWYPDALFTVDEYGLGQIIDIEQFIDEHTDYGDILNTICVDHLKEDDVKWYAHASYFTPDDEHGFMFLVIGNKYSDESPFGSTRCWIAQIGIINGYQELTDWKKLDPTSAFPEIIVPLRQAIVNYAP